MGGQGGLSVRERPVSPAHPAHHRGPSQLRTVHHKDPYTCHNPVGASTPSPHSAPSQHPSRLSSPAGLLARLLLWPLPRASIEGASASSVTYFLSLAFMERAVCSTSAASPPWKGLVLPCGLGGHTLTCPVPLCCLGPGKQVGLWGYSVPNMEPGRAHDAPGLESVSRAGCRGQPC